MYSCQCFKLQQNKFVIQIVHRKLATQKYQTKLTSFNNPDNRKSCKYKMRAWQLHSYEGLDDMQYSDKIKIPVIHSPNDVLIKVEAAGINPIDVEMIKGFGSTVFNFMRRRQGSIEFPLIMGREFCGKVVQCGMKAQQNYKLDDTVWGVVPIHQMGSHAEYVVVDADCIAIKPGLLDTIEASSILYAGLTAWSGLFGSGNLGGACSIFSSSSNSGGRGKSVCILGASGGVGNVAVQIAKAEGAKVTATCSKDAIEKVVELGADHAIDYSSLKSNEELVASGPYDIILDCAGHGPDYARQLPWKFSNYITFTSPLLKNFDNHGLPFGLFHNAGSFIGTNVRSLASHWGYVKWAFFTPSPNGIKYLANLVEQNKLKPNVQEVFECDSAISAYQRVIDGHLRGKIVIKM